MFDIVKFAPKEREYEGIELLEAGKLPQNIIASTPDVVKARGLVRKVKYLHFENYDFEQGLLKIMKERNCILAICLSDFFSLNGMQMVGRMRKAANLARAAQKSGVRVRIFTYAKDETQLRDEYEIYFIGKLLGIGEPMLKAAKEEKMREI
ncbi:hypothetical protein COU37_02095 [Candidatus Micrarchaeota archaeon CG10_big_fil_rev_8_21_14_0_10_45_29]|nr:MAG: hypothetical protein COU37_02095 [Candidatus Micrarchaeota archaeon CG10_big_fil_rev_8_21_14_0_10_45_29]